MKKFDEKLFCQKNEVYYKISLKIKLDQLQYLILKKEHCYVKLISFKILIDTIYLVIKSSLIILKS